MRLLGYIVAQFTMTLGFVVYELAPDSLAPERAFGALAAYLLACLLLVLAWKPWR